MKTTWLRKLDLTNERTIEDMQELELYPQTKKRFMNMKKIGLSNSRTLEIIKLSENVRFDRKSAFILVMKFDKKICSEMMVFAVLLN